MNTTNKLLKGDVLVDQYFRQHVTALVVKINGCGIRGWDVDILEKIKSGMKISREVAFSRDELQEDFIIFRKGQKLRYVYD